MVACGQDGVGIKRDCEDTGGNFGDDGYVHFLVYGDGFTGVYLGQNL